MSDGSKQQLPFRRNDYHDQQQYKVKLNKRRLGKVKENKKFTRRYLLWKEEDL